MMSPRVDTSLRPVWSSCPAEKRGRESPACLSSAADAASAKRGPRASSTTAAPRATSPTAASLAATRMRSEANNSHGVAALGVARFQPGTRSPSSPFRTLYILLYSGSTLSQRSTPSLASCPCAERIAWNGTSPCSAAMTPRLKMARSAGGCAAAKPSSCPKAIAKNWAPQNLCSRRTGASSLSARIFWVSAGSVRSSCSARISLRPTA